MSSHQWIDMEECQKENVPELLERLRSSEGYRVVGLEQTSESRTLGERTTKFSEKNSYFIRR